MRSLPEVRSNSHTHWTRALAAVSEPGRACRSRDHLLSWARLLWEEAGIKNRRQVVMCYLPLGFPTFYSPPSNMIQPYACHLARRTERAQSEHFIF